MYIGICKRISLNFSLFVFDYFLGIGTAILQLLNRNSFVSNNTAKKLNEIENIFVSNYIY